MSSALSVLRDVAHELGHQDNAITSDPIFIVQRKQIDVGYDPEYAKGIGWCDSETLVTAESEPERFARFEADVFTEDDGDKNEWTRTGYVERWEFVQPFLTRKAAEAFIASQRHNLGAARVYVESAHRNPEWKQLRQLLGGELLSLVEHPQAEQSNQ